MSVSAKAIPFSWSSTVAYWVATGLVGTVLLGGGVADLVGTSHVRAVMEQLGYPPYLAIILGVWKVPGAVALVMPRFPRLKEWAYAGAVFNFTGAMASHLAIADAAITLLIPIVCTGLTLASWALRPPSRRLV